MEYNTDVGKRINEIRIHREYTREKLSELADVSVQFLADIEKGRKSMTIATLRRIADALNVTTDYIVNGTETFSENKQINTMLASLKPYYREQAEKMLVLFVETIKRSSLDFLCIKKTLVFHDFVAKLFEICNKVTKNAMCLVHCYKSFLVK